MRYAYLLAALLLFAIPVSAQLGIGPEVGLNMSAYDVTSGGQKINTDPKFGGKLGIIGDITLNEHLYLQPGIFYVTNGYKTQVPLEKATVVFHTIEVPVNVEYKFGGLNSSRFFLGIGPYIALNQAGTVFLNGHANTSYGIQIGDDSSHNDVIKRIDVGAGINAGYQIAEGLFVRLNAQMGFVNLAPQGNADNAMKNHSFTLSIGYLFYRRASNGRILKKTRVERLKS